MFIKILSSREVPSIQTFSLLSHCIRSIPPNLGLTFSYNFIRTVRPTVSSLSYLLFFHSFRASYCLLISFAQCHCVNQDDPPLSARELHKKQRVQVGIWVITGRRNNFHSKRGAAREKEERRRNEEQKE